MTEIDVLRDLIEWSKTNNQTGLINYHLAINKKDAGRALLRFRIQQEPNYIFLLPDSLLNKLDYFKRPARQDPQVTELAKRLGCDQIYYMEAANV